ncbi:MAG: VOC family protein [Rhizobiaceae bacterium]
MSVLRIVANLETKEPKLLADFYDKIFDMKTVMDFGWITTSQSENTAPIQLSTASEGGSGTVVPNLSIEVDNLEDVLKRAKDAGVKIEYGPVDEPWGVRRFYIRDPANNLLNILSHKDK